MRIRDLLRTLKAERDARAEQRGFDSVDEESETQKRNQAMVASVGMQPTGKPGPDHWYKKPPAVVGLTVLGALLVIGIRYVLKHGLGLDV